MYEAVSSHQEIQKQFKLHENIFRYISNHTGRNITRFLDVYNLYFGISTEEEWGFELPPWTKEVWPDVVTQLAMRDYFVSMTTAEMRKMASGYLLQKVSKDLIKQAFLKFLTMHWKSSKTFVLAKSITRKNFFC